MSKLEILLSILLFVSLALNAGQFWRWHSYRSKPAGVHSYTATMPKVSQDQVKKDLLRGRKKPRD